MFQSETASQVVWNGIKAPYIPPPIHLVLEALEFITHNLAPEGWNRPFAYVYISESILIAYVNYT